MARRIFEHSRGSDDPAPDGRSLALGTSPALEVADPRQTEVRRLVVLVIVFVVTPTLLLLSVGVLVLVFGSATQDYVFGALILGLVLTMIAGIVATLAYIRREANLAKLQTEFVSKVSHDLRTPLTSIRMFVETLQLGRAREPDNYQQCLDVLSRETSRLTTMIDQLLGWARMEAGKRVYKMKPCRVAEVVDAAITAFEAQCIAHPVHLERHVPDQLPGVVVDCSAIVEALLNLLHNAHRYTADEKRIIVRCLETFRPAAVVIQVEDNGPGISKGEHRRIFEKFYRARDPLNRDLQGTGLGLAIVQHIVRGHGGSVSVDSEVGRGSVFKIVLPAAS